MKSNRIPIIIALISILSLPLFLFTSGLPRIVIGLFFILLFPGYTLLAALFPRHEIDYLERIALSLGLSLAIVSLLAFVLDYTPWGIRLLPLYSIVLLFILITSIISYLRTNKDAVLSQSLTFNPGLYLHRWKSATHMVKAVIVLFSCMVCAAMVLIVCILAFPRETEKFTEFYILDSYGRADSYPTAVIPGKPVDLIVGVINHEQSGAEYEVAVMLDGDLYQKIPIGSLNNGEKKEKPVQIILNEASENIKLEFYLYKDSSTKAYFAEPLYLNLPVLSFYTRDEDGAINKLTKEITQQDPFARLEVDVINVMAEPVAYKVVVSLDDRNFSEINTGSLEYMEQYERNIAIGPLERRRHKIVLWLYKDGDLVPMIDKPISFNVKLKYLK